MKKYIVTLTEDEREALGVLISKGKWQQEFNSVPESGI